MDLALSLCDSEGHFTGRLMEKKSELCVLVKVKKLCNQVMIKKRKFNYFKKKEDKH